VIRLRLVVLLATLAVGQASAQDARLQERLAPDLVRRVTTVVDSAAAEGLPTEPLVQKALEGAAKGAAPDRIMAAVSSLHAAMGRARSAIGAPADDQEIVVGALWLRAGGPPDALTRLKQRAGRRSVAVAITVMTDLVERGVSPADAVGGLDRLLGTGLPDADLLQVRDRVARAVLDGDPAGGALQGELSRLAPPGREP
jgi:hypothetical protein